MDGQNVRAAEQLVFGYVGRPGLFGRLRGQVRAPRDDVHAERRRDPRHPAADPPQAQHAQHRPAELTTDRRLPTTAAHRQALVDGPAGDGKDQRPGQFDRRLHEAAGRADVDAVFPGGPDVDGSVERPGGGDHLQPWQALDYATRKRCALTHHAHHIERRQPVHDGILVGDVIVEDGDVGARRHLRPVGHAQRHILVVVEDRDLHRANVPHLV
jgi:hypothetical protein